jgi:hypothetical protein
MIAILFQGVHKQEDILVILKLRDIVEEYNVI